MPSDTVQSLERAFLILETLAKSPGGLRLTELAGAVGLHKSTVHRLLLSLVSLGYAEKDSFSGLYRVTFKLLELSNAITSEIDVLGIAKPYLDSLAQAAGEAVHLVVPDGQNVVYVYKCDASDRAFQMRSRIGMKIPMYRTAAGKAILAGMSHTQVEDVWNNSEISQVTANTITDFDVLCEELKRVRSRGYAVDREENEPGVTCVGAAVCDYHNRAVAAVSVSLPATDATDERIAQLARLVVDCRDAISKKLGAK